MKMLQVLKKIFLVITYIGWIREMTEPDTKELMAQDLGEYIIDDNLDSLEDFEAIWA